jgi:catalase-peroxidase
MHAVNPKNQRYAFYLTDNKKQRCTMKTKHIFQTSALAVAILTVLTTTPVLAESQPTNNSYWWPEQLDLKPLRQHSNESNPLGKTFNYAEKFKTLDLKSVKKDIEGVLHTSQPW